MKSQAALVLVLFLLAGCGEENLTATDATPRPTTDAALPDAGAPDGACGARWASSSDPRFVQALDGLESWLRERGLPGGALAVIDGDSVMTGGLGVRTAGTCDPITAQTRFRIGLIAEAITASAILHAETAGVLRTDTPLAPAAYTLHQLMTATAGIGPLDGTCLALNDYFAARPPVWSKPGDVYDWRPEHMALAGLELARASGVSFEKAVRDRIVAPLGMTGFTFEAAEAEAGEHADGHHRVGASLQVQHARADDCGWTHPSHNAFATIGDLARFARMLVARGEGVLPATQVARMTGGTLPHVAPSDLVGDGMNNSLAAPVRFAYTGGFSAGYGQHLVVMPERSFAVVVLTNFGDEVPYGVTGAAVKAFQPDVSTEAPARQPQDAASRPAYVGVYRDGIGMRTITVAIDAARVNLTATVDGQSAPLLPYDRDTFLLSLDGVTRTLRFWRDAGGAPAIVTILGLPTAGPPFYRQ